MTDRAMTDRAQRERDRARQVLEQGRQRAAHRDDSLAAHRRLIARHALSVLTSDHRAFVAAIGISDVRLDVAFTESSDEAGALAFWRSAGKAYTDFSKIVVRVPMPSTNMPLRDFVIQVRGILHHETGHVRFTIPLTELWDRGRGALRDGSRRDLSVSTLQMAWNCLEDQRMEAAVVRATPRIAAYFTPMVVGTVLAETQAQGYMSGTQKQAVDQLGPWLALAGRDYLPNEIRDRARNAFDGFAEPFDVGSDDWFDIVASYMGSTDEAEMLQAVVDAHDLLSRLLDAVAADADSGHQHLKTMSMMQTKESLARKLHDPNEQHQQMVDSQGNDPHQSSTSPRLPRPTAPGASNDGADDVTMSTAEIDDALIRINERVRAGELSPELSTSTRLMSSDAQQQARLLAHELRDALEVFRTRSSPVWARYQEQGYLDAAAYRTRMPGERTYRREPRQWDHHGFGVHVSFLADRSGSMWTNMTALSQTLWAVRTACDDLEIPSTTVLWADLRNTHRVTDIGDEPMVFEASGGTNPMGALGDLDSHITEEGLHHLVFVFTDGDWAAPSTLTEWRRPDRTFVIIGLDCVADIVNKDADVVIPIASIAELGQVVKYTLADHVDMLTSAR